MEIATILIALIKHGPEAIDFAIKTYDLFAAGEMTEDELRARWREALDLAAKGEADWDAAIAKLPK